MTKPKSVAELQRLLRTTNYNRAFIPDYIEITRPLYGLMNLKKVPSEFRKKRNIAVIHKKVLLTWNYGDESSYQKLIQIMCNDLVLALRNLVPKFYVRSDPSKYCYGAVL